jgi:methylmalonyl-CoA mutase cobalamin-binding domain/chain
VIAPRRRTSIVVFAGEERVSDEGARALAQSLRKTGIEIVYVGRKLNAPEIAASAIEAGADAVEVCLAGGGGVRLLRELLRELDRLGRREVGIVVHRVQ